MGGQRLMIGPADKAYPLRYITLTVCIFSNAILLKGLGINFSMVSLWKGLKGSHGALRRHPGLSISSLEIYSRVSFSHQQPGEQFWENALSPRISCEFRQSLVHVALNLVALRTSISISYAEYIMYNIKSSFNNSKKTINYKQ